MNLRVASVDEYQFLICFKYNVWGAEKSRVGNWKQGDLLMFIVDKRITALAEVTGEPFVSDEILWDNGFYSNRIGLSFSYLLSIEDRIPVEGEIRDLFIKSWGKNYGIGILNKMPLTKEVADTLVAHVKMHSNSMQYYRDNTDEIVANIRQQRELACRNSSVKTEGIKTRKFKDKIIDIE